MKVVIHLKSCGYLQFIWCFVSTKRSLFDSVEYQSDHDPSAKDVWEVLGSVLGLRVDTANQWDEQ